MLYHHSHYERDRPLGTFWESSGAGPARASVPLREDRSAEVAIIGGGYTGLSCAYHLAREHGIQAVVLEAGPIGWGASGRNGGFCGLGGTKLGYGAMAERFGLEEARRYFACQKEGVALVRRLAETEGFDIEATGEGEHLLAHKPNRVRELHDKAALVERLFGERWPVWTREELAERLLEAPEAHGCLVVPHYFGLHPLRYVRGLAAAAETAGARVHDASPVTAWERDAAAATPCARPAARSRPRACSSPPTATRPSIWSPPSPAARSRPCPRSWSPARSQPPSRPPTAGPARP